MKPKKDHLFENQKAKAYILTGKATKEIILALRCMNRNTEKEREYLRKLIKRFEDSSETTRKTSRPANRNKGQSI